MEQQTRISSAAVEAWWMMLNGVFHPEPRPYMRPELWSLLVNAIVYRPGGDSDNGYVRHWVEPLLVVESTKKEAFVQWVEEHGSDLDGDGEELALGTIVHGMARDHTLHTLRFKAIDTDPKLTRDEVVRSAYGYTVLATDNGFHMYPQTNVYFNPTDPQSAQNLGPHGLRDPQWEKGFLRVSQGDKGPITLVRRELPAVVGTGRFA